MTPGEKNVLKSLVAVAWADGKMVSGESGVIEGLLAGFDATPEEETEIFEYAKTPRTLSNDIPVHELGDEDRELLLSNAALLTQVDGVQSTREEAILEQLVQLLGFEEEEAAEIVAATRDGVLAINDEAVDD
jgi:tellurite resistance protein